MLLYNIGSFTIRMVKNSMNRRKSQQKEVSQQSRQQQRKTQRRNKQRQQQQQQGQQQNGGMTGVLNTALVPFGLIALQKHQQKRVAGKNNQQTWSQKQEKLIK